MPTIKSVSESQGLSNSNSNSNSNNSCNSDDSVAFSKWREVDINDDDYNRGDDGGGATATATANVNELAREGNGCKNDGHDAVDGGQDQDAFFRMFGEDDGEDVYEEVTYDYDTPNTANTSTSSSIVSTTTTTTTTTTTSVAIRHHGDYPNSTGLAVWRGSEILARFLCDRQRTRDNNTTTVVTTAVSEEMDHDFVVCATAVRGKKILEVGAGAGLPGIVAHKVLGANSVLVTDGDYDALHNLKRNVDTNSNSNSNTHGIISCLQLIWGKGVASFLEQYGKQDIVLAADCVYMAPSLGPLWSTISALLTDDGVVVYAQTAASAVPWKNFSEMVQLHGFETCFEVVGEDLNQYDIDNDDDDDDETNTNRRGEKYEQGIYVFRRRRM